MAKDKPAKQDLVITTARIPRDFWARVRARAVREHLGTGELIIKALTEYLKKEVER